MSVCLYRLGVWLYRLGKEIHGKDIHLNVVLDHTGSRSTRYFYHITNFTTLRISPYYTSLTYSVNKEYYIRCHFNINFYESSSGARLITSPPRFTKVFLSNDNWCKILYNTARLFPCFPLDGLAVNIVHIHGFFLHIHGSHVEPHRFD